MCGGWGGLLAAVPFLAVFAFAVWWNHYRNFYSELDPKALASLVFCLAFAVVSFAWVGLCRSSLI
jgi:hypothetical protein